MKKLSFVFALMLSVVLFSCNKDEVNPESSYLEMRSYITGSNTSVLNGSYDFDPSQQNPYGNGEYAVPPFQLLTIDSIVILSQKGPGEWSVNDNKKMNMKLVKYAENYKDSAKCQIQIHLKTGEVYLRRFDVRLPNLVR